MAWTTAQLRKAKSLYKSGKASTWADAIKQATTKESKPAKKKRTTSKKIGSVKRKAIKKVRAKAVIVKPRNVVLTGINKTIAGMHSDYIAIIKDRTGAHVYNFKATSASEARRIAVAHKRNNKLKGTVTVTKRK